MNRKDIFDNNHTLFTDNRKISLRQIRRTLTLELFGVSSLLLPGYLARECGIFGVLALAAGAAGARLLLVVWKRLSDSGVFGTIFQGGKSIPQRMLEIAAGIGFLAICSYVLCLLVSLVREHLLGESYVPAILLTLTIAGIFGLAKGLEPRIRVYEVLFYFLLVPLIIILVLACVNVRPIYWILTDYSVSGILKSILVCFLFFSLSSVILMSRAHCNQPAYAMRSAGYAILFTAILDIALYLILLGIFQNQLLSQLPFPAILLMEVVKIPGRFFEREDTFMIGIWFFCLFALFHSTLYYGKELLQKGFAFAKRQRVQSYSFLKRVIVCLICGAAVCLSATLMLHIEGAASLFLKLLLTRIEPVLLVFPILYYLCRRRS